MEFLQRLRRRLARSSPAKTEPSFETTSMFTAETGRMAPARPAEMNPRALAWMASLPSRVRPLELGRRHPRLVNQLALCWKDLELTERIFVSLIVDDRGSRQGFAPAVLAELMNLREFHGDREGAANGAEPLWADSTFATVDR